MSDLKNKNRPEEPEHARYSPAYAAGRLFRWVASSNKKYGVEWWIMIAGIFIILLIAYMAFLPQTIAPFSPNAQNAGPQLSPPSARNIFGTDNLNRDVFSRVVWGSRTILGVAFSAALMSSVIGIPLGLFSGYVGGIVDRILSLIMDSVYAFPGLILAIAFAAMLGPGVVNITLAVAVIYIPTYFRLVRGQTLQLKEQLYVEAARSIGAKRGTILFRYIFPNIVATVVVVFSLNIADAITTEAALSYIGLGLPAGIPDWGMDLAQGKSYLPSGIWWMITFPGLMIMLLALGFTMLGEGLAEILNPRLLEK